jgi:hypothetical protein
MNRITLFGLSLVLAAITFSGCGGPELRLKQAQLRTTYTKIDQQVYQVTPGQVVLTTSKGENFEALRLNNRLVSNVMGITCTLNPQTFVTSEEDAKYDYYFSQTDRASSFTSSGGMHNQPCGLKISKTDPSDITPVCDTRNVACVGCGINSLSFVSGQQPAKVEKIPMINIYAPDFIRKTLKFDSFIDDFLALHYMEERGTENGYDSMGNPVGVPPQTSEQMYEFDLQASRQINVQGARLEVLDAGPDRLVFKVLSQMDTQ